MALVVKPQREPFSRPAGPGDGEKSDIIRGVAYQRLRAALEKYLRKRSSGRSFVISGNRGIGKSTMVLAVIEDLLVDAEVERKAMRVSAASGASMAAGTADPTAHTLCRPLLVILSGPDVIREQTRSPPAPKKDGETPPEPPGKVANSDNLLRQIARALHVSLAREFAQRYELTVATSGARAELIEAWAQLGLELSQGARVQSLSRFWELAGRLEAGVLFAKPFEHDRQGYCELIALEASAAAFRIAIGKVTENDDLTARAQTPDSEVSWGDQLRTLAAPVTGLVGGAVAGLGVHQLTAGTPATTWASLGAALVSGLTLSFGLAPKRTSTAVSTSTFTPDTEVGSLTWRLAGVVDRLFRAGIAPVFVIDELDKVAPPRQGLDWLSIQAQELKSLLTERAFFCFLTGREFAEKLHVERTERKYPPSYTMFSEYLFVNYVPQELHQHLRDRFERKDSPPTDSPEEAREALVAAVLPFVLLFRAEMHPIDVRRELNALIVDGDKLQLFTGYDLPPADAFALLFQIAIESVLSTEEVERRVRKDARFALLAIDAVYYAPRSWRVGSTLDIGNVAITEYLNLRRGPDEATPDEPRPSGDDLPALEPLPPGDLRMLLSCARQVPRLVRQPNDMLPIVEQSWFLDRLGPPGPERERLKSLIKAALPRLGDLLEPEADSQVKFQWRYDSDGLLVLSDVDMKQVQRDVSRFGDLQKVNARLRKEFDFGIEQIEGEFGLLQHTMKWISAVAIAQQLQGASGFGADAVQERTSAKSLSDYLNVVEAGLPRLGYAVILCQALAPTRKLKTALPILASALELQRLADDARAPRIAGAWIDYARACNVLLTPEQAAALADPFSAQDFTKWVIELGALGKGCPHPPLLDVEGQFWAGWGARIQDTQISSRPRTPPNWFDVAWHLARGDKAMVLGDAVDRNVASAWTEILLTARIGAPASDGVQYPPEFAALAAGSLKAWSLAAALTPAGSDLTGWFRRQSQESPRRFVVVVANDRPEGAVRWTASEHHVALVVGRNSKWLDALGESLIASHSVRAEDTWLLIEANTNELPTSPDTLVELASAFKDLWPPSRRAQLFAHPPKEAGVVARALRSGSVPRVIVGATSIDDAVQKADAWQAPVSS